jgi:hypothetical protein
MRLGPISQHGLYNNKTPAKSHLTFILSNVETMFNGKPVWVRSAAHPAYCGAEWPQQHQFQSVRQPAINVGFTAKFQRM